MLVPKTPVDEHDFAASRKHDIWLARKQFRMGSISIAKTEQQASDSQFGLGVFGSDPTHDLGAHGRRENVHGYCTAG